VLGAFILRIEIEAFKKRFSREERTRREREGMMKYHGNESSCILFIHVLFNRAEGYEEEFSLTRFNA